MSIGGVPTDRRVAIVGSVRDATALLLALTETRAVVVGVVAHEEPRSGRAGLAVLTSRARALGVPVLAPRGVTIPMAVDWLRNLALDYLVCPGWSHLLTEEMLRVPRHGTLGMRRTSQLRPHHRTVPDWALLRGETPTNHTMLALAPASGVPGGLPEESTEGPGRGTGNGNGDDDDGAAIERVVEAGSRLLEAELADVVTRRAGKQRLVPPAPLPGPPLGLTSFDRTADEVHRWITTLGYPRRGAFGVLGREIVVLWSCEPAGSRPISVPPGTVLGPDGYGIVVTTRCGSVRVLEVQAGEDAPEPATSWFQRRALSPGCAFEPVGWSAFDWMLS